DLDIVVDGVVTESVPGALAAVPVVQRALDEILIHRQTAVAIVHSGVVSRRGRAILLPGSSGAGKTTLVLELIRHGADYFSAEYGLADATGRVHPYPRALLPREGAGDRPPVLARELGGVVAREPAPASLIVSLGYAAGATPTLTPLTQGEGVLLLLRNTP